MSIFSVLALAFALSLDNATVAAAIGCGGKALKRVYALKLAFLFTLAHVVMLSAGWFGGAGLLGFAGRFAPWISFFILLFVGGKNIKKAISSKEEAACKEESFKYLLLLSLATSLDALAVGFSVSITAGADMPLLIGFAAVFVFLTTLAGFYIGSVLSGKFGKKIEILGGIILILIGAKILLEALA